MPIHIFKTDLKTNEAVRQIQPIFNLHPCIIDWHVDTQDIDNVLRIQSRKNMSEIDITRLLNQYQIQNEILND